MTQPHTSSERRLRLWPGVAIVLLQWLIRFAIPLIAPDASIFDVPLDVVAMLAGVLGGFAVLLWWLFFSRARWSERLGAVALMIVAMYVTSRIVDKSIAGGMMGMMLFLYSIPFLSLALVVWAVATANMADGARRVALIAVVLIACAPWTIVRTAGVFGGGSEFHWRWTDDTRGAAPGSRRGQGARSCPGHAGGCALSAGGASFQARRIRSRWRRGYCRSRQPSRRSAPRFRKSSRPSGLAFAGRSATASFAACESTPTGRSRRPSSCGAGRSDRAGPPSRSAAICSTRRNSAATTRSSPATGCPRANRCGGIAIAVRFWESNGGAGPRATPTLSNGRVYAFGATGILNALDAAYRRRRVVAQRRQRTPQGSSGLGLRQFAARRRRCRSSSPLPATLAALRRWPLASRAGSGRSTAAATARRNARRSTASRKCCCSAEPAPPALHRQTAHCCGNTSGPGDRDRAAGADAGWRRPDQRGLRRREGSARAASPCAQQRSRRGWNVQERWTSTGLKPYFNDFVVHNGYAFGFDGSILACIDLEDGARKWKGGRYGNGQLFLLADQDLLLVLSEEGELALVPRRPTSSPR